MDSFVVFSARRTKQYTIKQGWQSSQLPLLLRSRNPWNRQIGAYRPSKLSLDHQSWGTWHTTLRYILRLSPVIEAKVLSWCSIRLMWKVGGLDIGQAEVRILFHATLTWSTLSLKYQTGHTNDEPIKKQILLILPSVGITRDENYCSSRFMAPVFSLFIGMRLFRYFCKRIN